jgi:hypothetical protein
MEVIQRLDGKALSCRLTIAGETFCAYSAQSERRFHAIVNAVGVSAAEAADIGSGVHDGIDNGRISAMPCSDLQPTRNVGVAGVVNRAEPGV